jgi:hypothetical protein
MRRGKRGWEGVIGEEDGRKELGEEIKIRRGIRRFRIRGMKRREEVGEMMGGKEKEEI